MGFKSSHNLKFETRPYFLQLSSKYQWKEFRIGTCEGLWDCKKDNYVILAFDNKSKGNGHLDDVFEWFENSCKRDKKGLLILDVLNPNFKKHLIEKRGFKPKGKCDLIKIFKA